MGTDIHLYVETRNPNGSWSVVVPPVRDLKLWPRDKRKEDGWVSPFWGPHGTMCEGQCYGEDHDDSCSIVKKTGDKCAACASTGRTMQWYQQRNYDAFAILASVRNGHGFAGVDTGDGFKPIAEARGVPADCSAIVRDHNSWDHTPSWLLLSELLAFDWKQTTKHRGVVPMRDEDEKFPHGERDCYVSLKARGGGRPKTWSGSVSGRDIVTITPEKADAYIAGGMPELHPLRGKTVYVAVTWVETYAASADDFLAWMEHFLVPLAGANKIGGDVRIVFGFDS